MRLQSLKNRITRTTGGFPRNILIRDKDLAFKMFCMYDYATKLCGQQARVTQHYETPHIQKKWTR
jgi:predicted restriction endonuclease